MAVVKGPSGNHSFCGSMPAEASLHGCQYILLYKGFPKVAGPFTRLQGYVGIYKFPRSPYNEDASIFGL